MSYTQSLTFGKFVTAKELSNEVGRLQNLLTQRSDNASSESPRSPYTSPTTRSRNKPKGSSKMKTPNFHAMSEVQHEEALNIAYKSHQQEQIVVWSLPNNLFMFLTNSRRVLNLCY